MKPAFTISADGGDITAVVVDRLVSLKITDNAGVDSDRLTLTLDDRDQIIELPSKGAKIEASLGYAGGSLARMGRYVVDEVDVEGPLRLMIIRANAVDMTSGIRAPRERSWDEVTLGQVVQTIAGEHELQPAIASELASIDLGHVDQTESDMSLLHRLCADIGATCKVADGRLVVAKHASGQTTGGDSLPEVSVRADECESWNATLADRGQYKSVKASYQDLATAERKEVTAGSGEPVLTLRNSFSSEDEAQRAADSRLMSSSRGTRKISVTAVVGRTDFSAEKPANLTGFRKELDGGGWIINSVEHTIDGNGYTCALEIESKE